MRYETRKIGKPNNSKFWSNKTKGPKQDSQNQLRSPIPERENPSFINNYIIKEL